MNLGLKQVKVFCSQVSGCRIGYVLSISTKESPITVQNRLVRVLETCRTPRPLLSINPRKLYQHLTCNNFYILQSEEISKHTEKLVNDVATTLLSRMVVDQEPQKLKTKSLDVVLNRLSPRSLTNDTNINDDDMGFKLPLKAITEERTPNATFIDAVVSRLA